LGPLRKGNASSTDVRGNARLKPVEKAGEEPGGDLAYGEAAFKPNLSAFDCADRHPKKGGDTASPT